MFYSCFKPDHLLNVIVLGVYANRLPKCYVFQNKNWCSAKFGQWFFWLSLSEDLSIGKILSEKNIWDYGVNFWKNGSFVCKLNEIAEAVPSIDSAADDFLQFIYSVLVAKNY